MDKEKRIQIEIERLKSLSDYQKFEVNQFNTLLIGIFTILIAIYIPVYVSIPNNIIMQSTLSISFLVIAGVFSLKIKNITSQNIIKINRLSKNIESKYNELLSQI